MINIDRLTTGEAAARLGVKPATLYAYVSRGLLHSERGPGGSTFDAREVARMIAGSRRSGPGRSLTFVTSLTLIEDGSLFYRGEDAVVVARQHSFEEAAMWLWTGQWLTGDPWDAGSAAVAVAGAAQRRLPATSLPIDRLKVVVAASATVDELRYQTSAAAVVSTARTLIATAVEALPLVGAAPAGRTLAARLWSRLVPSSRAPSPRRLGALDSALVLLADHELAASTLAVRVAAAFGADPYAVVGTGLGAASGSLHGASSLEVETLLQDALDTDPARAVGAALRRRGKVAGLGQPLYPAGDPRGRALLDLLPELGAPRRRLGAVRAVLDVAADRSLPPPNADFALGALAFCCEMIPGAGEAVFTIGRMAGWIGHALEEYESGTTFRVRATYVGARPPRLSRRNPVGGAAVPVRADSHP